MSHEVTAELLRGWPLPSPAASEKHSRGVALVVAGSASTPGSARLAAEAALRAGCGKVRIATVASAAAALAVLVPEARVFGFDEAPSGDLSAGAADAIGELAADADVTLVGSGFVDPGAAEALVAAVAPSLTGPVVLDALASAYAGSHRDLADLPGPCVLTVNPSELAQVLDVDQDEIEADPTDAVSRLAGTSGAVVLLGAETKLVAAPGGPCHRITTGGPGLAIAGSGDVQAGLVAGLLARGAQPAQAAVWGGWLHAAAGDRLAARVGSLGFLTRELAAEVPPLLDELV
jgi:ADP-dependent NAD(P)H-hydrate dehydratase